MKKISMEKSKILREKIGIKGVDDMIEGGIAKGSIVGLSGPPGVGKSIFTLHFLLEGARNGQKCVYINLEEPLQNIYNMISQFDFSEEFFEFVKKEKIVIKCYDYFEYEKIYLELFEKIKKDNTINRLVIDTFNCFFNTVISTDSLDTGSEKNIRKIINQTFSNLRSKNIAVLLILEEQLDKQNNIYYNIPHLVDGIISLDFLELGTIERRIFMPKMRWTNQYKESKIFEINNRGIVVLE